MFTGLIEEIGKVHALTQLKEGTRLSIEAPYVTRDCRVGDSIAINGCCLTVAELHAPIWTADVVTETLQRTSLGDLHIGDPVNLESALRFNGRLGGHLVQGHVDGTGAILSKMANEDGSTSISVSASANLLRYIIEKGSIAVDGISLTVTHVTNQSFSFVIIPHTAQNTNIMWKQIDQKVNLEVDLTAKYIEKLIAPYPSRG